MNKKIENLAQLFILFFIMCDVKHTKLNDKISKRYKFTRATKIAIHHDNFMPLLWKQDYSYEAATPIFGSEI